MTSVNSLIVCVGESMVYKKNKRPVRANSKVPVGKKQKKENEENEHMVAAVDTRVPSEADSSEEEEAAESSG